MTPTPPVARRVPIWLWVVIAVVAVALIATAVLLLTAKHPVAVATHSPQPSHSPTAPVTASTTPTPTTSQTALPAAGAFDSSMDDYIASALDTQNTAVFSDGGVFTDPIVVVAAASDQSGPMAPDDAVSSMSFMFDPTAAHDWDLALPAITIAAYRAGPYGYFFPAGAIVARSFDGHVFSFVGHDKLITAMYMAASEDLLLGH
ncbi:MAG: hypothetical protein V4479_15505 [Actinomycetota bacterium]